MAAGGAGREPGAPGAEKGAGWMLFFDGYGVGGEIKAAFAAS